MEIKKYIDKRFSEADSYEREHLEKDWLEKERKSEGLIADFKKRVGEPCNAKILDVGFGNGIILGAFAKVGAIMSGVEVDEVLVSIAEKYLLEKKIRAQLKLYNGRVIPFLDDSFDFVYSTSVIEHVSYPEDYLKEIYRVLKKGGRFYLAFPNGLNPRDPHTNLYFLGYMPHSLAGFVSRFFGKSSFKEWNLHFLNYFSLVGMLKKNNVKFKVLMETESKSSFNKLIKKVLACMGIHYSAILSHVIVVLEK